MRPKGIGQTKWSFAGGYIPVESTGMEPAFVSKDKLAVLNTTDENAQIRISIYFTEQQTVGEYKIEVKAQRVRKFRLNDLIDPHAIPLGVPYGATIESNVPVVVQLSKQYTVQNELALMSTVAYSETKQED